MSAVHTPGLTRDQVFGIADKYGEFQFGDAQGQKRLAFAADVIEAHERIRAAAPTLLEALQSVRAAWGNIPGMRSPMGLKQQIDDAIAAATGEQA